MPSARYLRAKSSNIEYAKQSLTLLLQSDRSRHMQYVTGTMWAHSTLQPEAQTIDVDFTSSQTSKPNVLASCVTASPTTTIRGERSSFGCSAASQYSRFATDSTVHRVDDNPALPDDMGRCRGKRARRKAIRSDQHGFLLSPTVGAATISGISLRSPSAA